MRRWTAALWIPVLFACSEGPTCEWVVQIDPNWGSVEERQAVYEEEVAALRSRVEEFEGSEVESLENGEILIRHRGHVAPFLIAGNVALQLVCDGVDLRSILPELDSVLAAHSPVPTPGVIPGTQAMPLQEPEGAYPIRDTDIEDVLDYLDNADVGHVLGPDKTFAFGFFTERGELAWYLYVIQTDPLFTSDDVERADPLKSKGIWQILPTLTREAGNRVETSTARHVGGRVALVFDGVVLGRPAVIKQAVGRHISIDVPRYMDEFNVFWLALYFRTSALPAPLVVLDTNCPDAETVQ